MNGNDPLLGLCVLLVAACAWPFIRDGDEDMRAWAAGKTWRIWVLLLGPLGGIVVGGKLLRWFFLATLNVGTPG